MPGLLSDVCNVCKIKESALTRANPVSADSFFAVLFICGLIHLRSYSFAVLFIFGEEQTADPEEDHPQECKDEKQQHKAREP